MRAPWLLLCVGCGVDPIVEQPPPEPVIEHVVHVTQAGPFTGTKMSVPIEPSSAEHVLVVIAVHESDAFVDIKDVGLLASTGRVNACGRAAMAYVALPPRDVTHLDVEVTQPTTFALWTIEVTNATLHGSPPDVVFGSDGEATAPLAMSRGQIVLSTLVGCGPSTLVPSEYTSAGVALDSEVAFAEVADETGEQGATWQTTGAWSAMTLAIK